jgi:hypothetical protein
MEQRKYSAIILDIDTSFKPRPLYHPRMGHPYLLDRRLGGFRAGLDDVQKRKIFRP